jgi:AcrR family transcriptional regulator
MCARRYQLGQRQVATEQTRARILAAAQELLTAPDGIAGFTVDAVARQAGVARMTVYYQFGSKTGLLEALCDVLAVRGGIEQLAGAFCQPEAREALAELIAVFGRFWSADRLVLRRLHGLAALDPEIGRVIGARQLRRREGLRILLARLAAQHGRRCPKDPEETLDVLLTLTSFETFDSLAGERRTPGEVTPLVRRLVFGVLGLGDD